MIPIYICVQALKWYSGHAHIDAIMFKKKKILLAVPLSEKNDNKINEYRKIVLYIK